MAEEEDGDLEKNIDFWEGQRRKSPRTKIIDQHVLDVLEGRRRRA